MRGGGRPAGDAVPAIPELAGAKLVAELSRTERGRVLHLRHEARDLVLRIGVEDAPGPLLEASLAAQVSHPALAPTLRWGRLPDGRPWTLREHVPGRPFDEAARAADEPTLRGWVATLLGALAELHEAGLVHRDVRAGNVVVGPAGPVLVDLDLLARQDDAQAAGSPLHLAPELLLGQPATPASDLFALGAMLALLHGGVPRAGFHRDFPRQDFWTASGLSAERLPKSLAALVHKLVRRRPSDRPPSARAAAQRLLGEPVPPQPSLPLLAGREQQADELAAALVPRGLRRVLLLSLADEDEREPLAAHVALAAALAGRRLRALPEAEALPPAPAAGPAVEPSPEDVFVLSADEVADGLDAVARFELAAPRAGLLVLLLPAAGAAALAQRLAARPGHEARELAVLDWPRPTVDALARRLDTLTGGASPDAARRLAADLHARTGGRHAALDAALRRAVSAGVLRVDGGHLTLLATRWPDDDPALATALPGDLAQDERALLAALALAGQPLRPGDAATVAALSEDALSRAAAALRRRGLLDTHGGRLAVRDRRVLAAARETLPPDEAVALHGRCAEVLAAAGAPLHEVVGHRLAARGEAALDETLEAALALLDSGHPAGARQLLGAAGAHVAAGSAHAARHAALLARCELAQGDAAGALARLQQQHGDALAGLPPALALVAAHAAEQSGRRDLARRLDEEVLAASDATVEERLRAVVGLAYADWLDGDAEQALARLEAADTSGAPDGPAAALLATVRGLACLRLARLDEAGAAFDDALARAQALPDPSLRARALLNRALLDRRRGAVGAAHAALEQAAEAFTRAGHVQGRALALNNLGVLERDRGELRRAQALLLSALALRRRVGDRLGTGSSLGSLGIAQLEAGEVGAALSSLEQAAALLAEGEWAAEQGLVGLHRALALSLLGRHAEAASQLSSPAVAGLGKAQPAALARVEALVHLAAEQRSEATARARAALAAAEAGGDRAEAFRAAALLLALHPDDGAAEQALERAAEALDAPARRQEAAFRSHDARRPDVARLSRWTEAFEQQGRTDLLWAGTRLLLLACQRQGDDAGRRAAAARGAAAAEALTDGVPEGERQALLARLARLTGPRPPGERRGAALGVDWLLSCNRRLAREADLDGLLLSIVDMALELTGSERGFLVLAGEQGDEVSVARHMDQQTLPPEEVRFSRTVVAEALATGEPVLTTDAAADARFAGSASLASLRLRAVLCVPVPAPGGPVGALYLDVDSRRSLLDEVDVARVAALADQASVAIAERRRRAEVEALNRRLAERVAFQADELQRARGELRRTGRVAPVGGLVGESEAMQAVYALVERVAPTDLAVLVTGPSGSGKDLLARALHERSARAQGPFVIENVAAVPANLLESELFGHVRGAFTGADRDRPGLFAEANGGTFVLDEIGELPLELQPKLLRVLESGEVRPVGSRRTVHVDVRIVAVTNRDLAERVREGAFRQDLYYRLDGVQIRMPPLSERLDDLPLLVRHVLARLNERHGTAKTIADDVLAALVRRPWPGQVRELSHEVSRLYHLSDARIVDARLVRAPAALGDAQGEEAGPLRLEDVERATIERALAAARGRKDKAAGLLGISRAGLYAKLKRFGLHPSDEG